MTTGQPDRISFNLPLHNEEAIQQFLSLREHGSRMMYLTALEMARQQQQEASQRAGELLELFTSDERTRDLVSRAREAGEAMKKKLPRSKARRRF